MHHRNAAGERFYILTNEDAPNWKLMTTPSMPWADNWQEVIAHRDDMKLDGLTPWPITWSFPNVRSKRTDRLLHFEGNAHHRRPTRIHLYRVPIRQCRVRNLCCSVQLHVSSYPKTVFEMDIAQGERTVLKQQPVLGEFHRDNYARIVYGPPHRTEPRFRSLWSTEKTGRNQPGLRCSTATAHTKFRWTPPFLSRG